MNDPIVVNADGTPDALWKALRQLLLVVGGWAVGRGYLEADTLSAIGTVFIIAAPLLYGQWMGWKKHKALVATADAAPDRVAEVK